MMIVSPVMALVTSMIGGLDALARQTLTDL
jgi:hypothetical protein